MYKKLNWVNLFFGLILGLSIAFPASAEILNQNNGSIWTIYAFGNAQAMSDTLRAVANFVASPMFKGLVGFIAVVGVLVIGMTSRFSPDVARKFIGYLMGVFVITYAFFGVGTSGALMVQVEIIDTVEGTWKAPITIPAVIGIPASVISEVGRGVTKQIESSFMIPDEFKMGSGAPFNLAAAFINDASKLRITDPNLASSLAYYVQDCFTIGVARGDLTASTLVNSTDFINDIRFDSKAVMVATLLSEPPGISDIVSCSVAWSLINASINKDGTTADAFLKNASAWARTPAMSVLNASADKVAQWATSNGTANGGAFVKQAAVLGAFKGSMSQVATATGNSEFLTSLTLAQAKENQTNTWITSAEVFNRMMGYIYAVIQVFVYALMPLVLAAALIPGLGFALFKNFAQILLWLAIWQPMLAIVNFIILSMQQSELGGILAGVNSSAAGFSLGNLSYITEKTSNMRAAALFIGTMVPVLAWSLVKGSMDFSKAMASAGGEQFAAQAATTQTTGNYSLNNASMDSFTANKNSIGSTGDWGGGNTTKDGSMNQMFDQGGSTVQAAGIKAGIALSAATTAGTGILGSNTAAASITGTDAVSGGKAFAAATNGGVVASGTRAAAGVTAATLGTGVQVALAPNGSPANGGPAVTGGGTTPVGPSAAQGVNTSNPENIFKKGAKVIAGAVKPTANFALNAIDSNTNTSSKSATSGNSGSSTQNGGKTTTYANGNTQTQSVAETNSAGATVTQTVTPISNLMDRADANRAALDTTGRFFTGSRLATPGSEEHARYYGGSSGNSAQARADGANAPGAVDAQVATKTNELTQSRDNVLSDIKKQEVEANKKRALAEAAALQMIRTGNSGANPETGVGAPTGSLPSRIIREATAIAETGKDAFTRGLAKEAVEAVDFAIKAKEKLDTGVETVKDKASKVASRGLTEFSLFPPKAPKSE